MRINQNAAAINAFNNLNQTQQRLSGSLEKLSSGFRINRAADDASGLVNSENLRAQIGGLQVATRNAQDAISLVQTAEGALNETHSILQRMRSLVTEAGNGGTNDAAAIQANQDEIDALARELDRIGGETQFGTTRIFQEFTGSGQTAPAVTNITDVVGGGNVTATDANGDPAQITIDFTDAPTNLDPGREITVTFGGVDEGDPLQQFSVDFTIGETAAQTAANLQQALEDANPPGFDLDMSIAGNELVIEAQALDTAGDRVAIVDTFAPAIDGPDGAVFQVGANADQREAINISEVDSGSIGAGSAQAGTNWQYVDDIDLTDAVGTSGERIDSALNIIDGAIAEISTQRAELGAFQNRMESLVRNVSVAVENLTAAESRIRDTDMALEMVEFTRNQILSQSGTAMLAQANAVPQSVLSLLN